MSPAKQSQAEQKLPSCICQPRRDMQSAPCCRPLDQAARYMETSARAGQTHAGAPRCRNASTKWTSTFKRVSKQSRDIFACNGAWIVVRRLHDERGRSIEVVSFHPDALEGNGTFKRVIRSKMPVAALAVPIARSIRFIAPGAAV